MTPFDRIGLAQFRALQRLRGETVHYRRHDSAEPVTLTLPPAGDDLREVGEVDTPHGADAFDWLAHRGEFVRRVGRMPEQGDTVQRAATGERHLVCHRDDPRAWRPQGPQGGLFVFFAVTE